MTEQEHLFRPPRVAVWFMNLIAPSGGEAIAGDLLEESSQLASKSGISVARAWYWRQTVKSVADVFVAEFCGSPGSIAAIVFGGYILHHFLLRLSGKLLSALTDRYLGFWSTHFWAYEWLLTGTSIEFILASVFVGCMVGLAAKGRELVAAALLAFIFCGLIGAAWVWVAMHGPIDIAWMLWSCIDPIGILLGATIVRTRRLANSSLDTANL